MKRAPQCALLVVLALAAGSPYAFAQRLACSTIQPGETAARVAMRITGDARNRHEPWFQIVDPAASRFIAKARYGRIRAGWQACIVNEPAKSGTPGVLAGPLAIAGISTVLDAIIHTVGGVDFTLVWWGALVVAISLVWRSADEYVTDRQTVLDAMKRFGETFIREFEGPLIQQHLPERPIRSRMRASPHRRRLEILLAPHGGRRYPNLSDHKKNVDYDVTRVLQLLRDQQFVCRSLYAQGPWVVVPFQFHVGSAQAGRK